MSEQNNVPELKEREARFNEGLKQLCRETQLALQVFPFINQDGQIGAGIQLIDDTPEAKAARESQQAQANGVAAA